jgi:protein-L-isoaspartate(D-aspartate) O-methyltransferase
MRFALIGIAFLTALLLVACTSDSTPAPAADTTTPLPEATSLPPTPTTKRTDPFERDRQAMVEEGVVGWGISDPAVIEVMGIVPRHEFVPDEFLSQAYRNHPLPIGFGQTISQPYIVALMTQALEVSQNDVILEIGTGSGYQAAVMAELVDHVYTMEIITPLAEKAAVTLDQLGYDNVTVSNADGYFGWQEQAPFDAIIVTAAPDHIPQPLVEQLKIGGRLIVPVGPVGGIQTLWLVSRISEDEVRTQNLGDVRFVPLTREES